MALLVCLNLCLGRMGCCRWPPLRCTISYLQRARHWSRPFLFRLKKKASAMTVHSEISPITAGLRCRCPRCGEGDLLRGFLQVEDHCESCGFSYGFADSGDGPAVFIMMIVGFVVVGAAWQLKCLFRRLLLSTCYCGYHQRLFSALHCCAHSRA